MALIYQYILVLHGTSWYFMVLHGTSWYPVVLYGTTLRGSSWYFMVFHDMSLLSFIILNGVFGTLWVFMGLHWYVIGTFCSTFSMVRYGTFNSAKW